MKSRLDLMTIDDFNIQLKKPRGEYYAGRWAYFKEVINIIENEAFESVVELGPGFTPIVRNRDVILNPLDDQFGKPDTVNAHTYVFDATTHPWPIKYKQYDLFIGLQVWEHLDNKQTRAFKEVMRIARNAILSFPYMWDGGEEKPSHRAHRDIDTDLINDWTLNIPPAKIIEIPRTGPAFNQGPRMIYYWKF